MPQSKTEWLALDYSLPANPSRARVYVWRRLKSLGAQQLRPGMAVLPNTRENAVQFEALAEKVRALQGEAILLGLNFLSPADAAAMRERFSQEQNQRQKALADECTALLSQLEAAQTPRQRTALRRRLSQLERELRRQEPLNELEQGLSELLNTLRGIPSELSELLRTEKE